MARLLNSFTKFRLIVVTHSPCSSGCDPYGGGNNQTVMVSLDSFVRTIGLTETTINGAHACEND